MAQFLTSRVLQSAIILFLMSFLVYVLIGLMPGDPIDIMLAANPHASAEDAARLRAIYGLDRPLYERYGAWLGAVLSGDFGHSRLYSQPVTDVLWPRLWATLKLLGIAVPLAVLIAVPIGVYAARKPYTATDNAVNLFCFAGVSIPPFWLALLLISLFAVTLGWLPAGGTGAESGEGGFLQRLSYLVMPVMTLTVASLATYTRHVRSAMMEALRADHVRTARAKGCSERRVVWKHALRNAATPLVTIVALDFGTLFGGALITETMFAWPGMGKLIYDAIMGNDYNLALVALLFVTLMILVGNLLADAAYAALDPRVSFREGAS